MQRVVGEFTAKREQQNGDTRSPLSPGGRDGFGSGGGPTQVIPLQVRRIERGWERFGLELVVNFLCIFNCLPQVYTGFVKQQNFLSYLVNCQDLWDQADNQVVRGGHAGEKQRE